jgi:hypothetical protein
MKFLVVIAVFCGLAVASADILDSFRSLKVIKDGKHEALLQALHDNKIAITEQMIVDAMQNVYDNYLMVPAEDESPITPDDIQCGFTFLAIIEAIQNRELWPLFMVDPWAKIQSGFVAGNIRNPGHFLQCINMNIPITSFPQAGNLTGKHCTIGIRGFIESGYEWPGGLIPPDPIFDV